MEFLYRFFHQKVPESENKMPGYYRNALFVSELLLGIYSVLSFFLIGWVCDQWMFFPLLMLVVTVICIRYIDSLSARLNLGIYMLITFVWCGWYVRTFGWGLGGQHFLIPVLVLGFFNIYEPPGLKLFCFFGLIICRMLLFYRALLLPPVCKLDQNSTIIIQTVNSLAFFTIMAGICILISTNMQDAERQLILANQELHKQAGTDPLTQLPNRRAMMNYIEQHLREIPDEMYCVAIADIDFFKKVNDTYGHDCGDYTLKTLAAKFQQASEKDRFKVCRWGGEEFCFFLPSMNIDAAWDVMNALCLDVSRMPLSFKGVDFSITITIGVAECDYQSPVEVIIKDADTKLYMGKDRGRNQVVM